MEALELLPDLDVSQYASTIPNDFEAGAFNEYYNNTFCYKKISYFKPSSISPFFLKFPVYFNFLNPYYFHYI